MIKCGPYYIFIKFYKSSSSASTKKDYEYIQVRLHFLLNIKANDTNKI